MLHFKWGVRDDDPERAEYLSWMQKNKEKCNIDRVYDFGSIEVPEGFDRAELGDIICSYDKDSHNFHQVPATYALRVDKEKMPADERRLTRACREMLIDITGGATYGSRPKSRVAVRQHYYRLKKCPSKKYEYLISFNRLVCSDDGIVRNYLGFAQFMRIHEEVKQINFSKERKFKMMYPASALDGEYRYDHETGNCVYNAPFIISPSFMESSADYNKDAHDEFVRDLKKRFCDFIGFSGDDIAT